jgi:hypothetical protein
MAGTTIPYQIVIFTHHHSINGGIFLHDQRLSDYLNDRREKNLMLRNASVARLENPARVLEKTQVSILPKSGIVLAFAPSQTSPFPPRFIKYPKDKYDIFIILDGMEVRGEVHIPGPLDFLNLLADAGDSFLPLTKATVIIEDNPSFPLKQEAVLVNTQRILVISKLELQTPTEPRP